MYRLLFFMLLVSTLLKAQTLDWTLTFPYPGNFPNTHYSFVDDAGSLKLSLHESGYFGYAVFAEIDPLGNLCLDSMKRDSGEFNIVNPHLRYIGDTSYLLFHNLDTLANYISSSLLRVNRNCSTDTLNYPFDCRYACAYNNPTVSCLCNDSIYLYDRSSFQESLRVKIKTDTGRVYVNSKFFESSSYIFMIRDVYQENKSQVAVIDKQSSQLILDSIFQGISDSKDHNILNGSIYFIANENLFKVSSNGLLDQLNKVNAQNNLKELKIHGNYLYTISDTLIRAFTKRALLEKRDSNGQVLHAFFPDTNARFAGGLHISANGQIAYGYEDVNLIKYLAFSNIDKFPFERVQVPSIDFFYDQNFGYYSFGFRNDSVEIRHFTPNLSIIEEPSTNPTLMVYPNPTSNFLFIQDAEPGQAYQIADVLGRIYQQGNYQETIDVSDLPAGLYLVQMGEHSWKFLKK